MGDSSTETPRISVVMTAYSHSEFIPAAVESILEQEVGPVEIILVDDGSKEDIPAVVEPYQNRLRYIRQENAGLGSARNTGLYAARGEYVAFCDSDDIHLKFRLSSHAQLLDQAPECACVFSDLALYVDGEVTAKSTLRGRFEYDFDAEIAGAFPEGYKTAAERGIDVPEELRDTKIYQGRITDLIAKYHVAWGGASMYRRAALIAIGGHDESLRRWPDWYLASMLCKSYEFIYMDTAVLLYRQHGGQLTKQSSIGARCYRDIVYKVWKSDPVFAARRPELLRYLVARASLGHAHYLMQDRAYAEARPALYDYIRVRPTDRQGYTALLRNLVMDKIMRRGQQAP